MVIRNDYSYPPQDCWDHVLPHFDTLTIETFAQSGHTPFFEQPEQFSQALLNWFDRDVI